MYRINISYIDGLMQERRNSHALAMELRLSCINPSIYGMWRHRKFMTTVTHVATDGKMTIKLA